MLKCVTKNVSKSPLRTVIMALLRVVRAPQIFSVVVLISLQSQSDDRKICRLKITKEKPGECSLDEIGLKKV